VKTFSISSSDRSSSGAVAGITSSAAVRQDVQSEGFVRFEHVKKSYDGLNLVVKDLNLSVKRGEFLTMLGPSGSGKTTTLMMLGGFEQPTKGHILLDGKPVERLPPEQRNIGFVFQNYALFPHMSVAENVAFPLRYRGIKGAAARERVEKALNRVQLGAFGGRKPGQLSGGQQQRVALARALVFEPTLVLMDEPLGALDKQLREHMQVEIKHLQQSLGITMVYVTHDQSEALTMSDRIAVFNDGCIQQLADPKTLYNAPENRFVAGFIGENNLIPCRMLHNAAQYAVARTPFGAELAGIASRPAVAGQDVFLSVRPENLALAGDSQGGNRFTGMLKEVFFLGDHIRLCVTVPGADDLVARISPKIAADFTIGQAVTLMCRAEDCRLLVP